MRCAIFGDVHWSQNSSIIRSRGSEYSARLENLIRSMNWMEHCAFDHGCQAIICMGDFFDSSVLNSEECSALQKIEWAPISHVFITGNHETNVSSLEYGTSDIFKLCPNAVVFNKPEHFFIDGTDAEFCFLPYILERDRKPLNEYFDPPTTKRIIFSHNDIKDIQYGPFLSTEGFTVEEIESYCDLMFNGHIHHCAYVSPKIIHTGNLSGQNFTEDAYKYSHCIQILDTDTLKVDFFENPFAFNFYKIDATDVHNEQELAYKLTNNIKYNAVVTVKVKQEFKNLAQTIIDNNRHTIVEHRIIVEQDLSKISSDESAPMIQGVDHLKQFESYVLSTIGTSDEVKEELLNIMR